MRATVYFIYENEPARSFECENTKRDIEDTIRYWMGKSPGMYNVKEFVVVPENQKKDWMYVLDNIREEEAEQEKRLIEEEEKSQFERLKKKFGNQ